MKELLELKSISAGYKDNIVLNDVNLKIFDRDFLGIIGPNGGGKTTLLKIILGLLQPIKGRVEFYEKSLISPKRNIGYLPQFASLDSQFPISVIDVVLSGLTSGTGLLKKISKIDKEKAHSILNRLGIHELKYKSIGELSGGQMQRVFLGRAIVSSPGLLILDEPSTFIDPGVSHNLNEILKELNDDIAIVIVSHDTGSILSSVKNIACVNGTLFYHSNDEFSEELFDNIQCPIRLVGHGNIPHSVLKAHEK